jgi:hypothetical protein
MADCAVVTGYSETGNRDPKKLRNDEEPEITPDKDLLMEQILDGLRATPQREVLKRIAILPDIRRGKVVNIRRQLTVGTYKVAGRLDRVIDRILAIITG